MIKGNKKFKKNWLPGDTFAVKIETDNKEFKKYNGRYLLLTKFENENIKTDPKYPEFQYFRAKITKDETIPTTQEEFDKLELIKYYGGPYNLRLGDKPMEQSVEELIESKKHIKVKPDKYGLIYTYIFRIFILPKKFYCPEFKYIGNFKIEIPEEEEFIKESLFISTINSDKFVNELLESYETFNLKKGKQYTKRGIKETEKFNERIMNKLYKRERGDKIVLKRQKEGRHYSYGWGPKLYDNDIALYVKSVCNEIYDKNKTGRQILNKLTDDVREYANVTDGIILYLVLVDKLLRVKKLTPNLKSLGYKAIEGDLKYWETTKYYDERKKELDKIKKRLDKYEFEE